MESLCGPQLRGCPCWFFDFTGVPLKAKQAVASWLCQHHPPADTTCSSHMEIWLPLADRQRQGEDLLRMAAACSEKSLQLFGNSVHTNLHNAKSRSVSNSRSQLCWGSSASLVSMVNYPGET